MGRKGNNGLREEKRNIIGQLIEMYHYFKETLYQKKNGEFFLHIEGQINSIIAQMIHDNLLVFNQCNAARLIQVGSVAS